jgi:hypothetical protein
MLSLLAEIKDKNKKESSVEIGIIQKLLTHHIQFEWQTFTISFAIVANT